MHFAARDLEAGNAGKGLAGTGDGAGSWRLVFEPEPADLDLRALAYVRNPGLASLAALHDTAPGSAAGGSRGWPSSTPRATRGLRAGCGWSTTRTPPPRCASPAPTRPGSRARAR